MGIYDFKVLNNKGNEVSLSDYNGKVLLIVNTATGCGFTPQYDGLQKLYDKYSSSGFEILDFPCNQFANQAPGNDEEIATFCKGRFGVTFPQFHKIDVNGENESQLYAWLKSQKSGALGNKIKWNFTKFIVDRNGNVASRFAPTKTPEQLAPVIEKLL
jgi:Glutathione peroxidase